MTNTNKTRAQWHSHYCEECGNQFDSSRYDAKFCGATCRSINHRKQFKKQKAIDNAKKAIDELRTYCGSPDAVEVMHQLIRWLTNAADEGELRIEIRQANIEQKAG